jgi:sugar lactone lactonase YvrE
VIGQSIFRVDTGSGAVTTFIGPREGMADDLAIGADGTFVWTAIEDGSVYARSPGGPIRRLMEDQKGANAVSFSPDGKRLFATLVFYGDALYELDVTGARPPRLILKDIGGLNAFEVADDGMIYGPLVFKRSIVRINPDTGAMATVSSDFMSVGALKLDFKGSAYVLDNGARALKRVDLATGRTAPVAQLPHGADNLDIDSRGRVFVSLSEVNAIIEVDPATGSVRYVVKPAPLTSATGLAVASEGGADVLFLGDLFGGVKRIDGRTGAIDETPIAIFQPAHVSVTRDRLLVVSEVFGAIQRIDRASYETVAEWTGFTSPGDALEAPGGDVVVAETGTGRLLLVTGPAPADRRVIAEGLATPRGLAWASAGAVYVSEASGGRVSRIALGDGARSVVASGLAQPEGIAVLPDGALAVVEVGAKRLTRIAAGGGTMTPIASNLPIGFANGPSLYRGVAASGSAIYINSDVENAVYRITPP